MLFVMLNDSTVVSQESGHGWCTLYRLTKWCVCVRVCVCVWRGGGSTNYFWVDPT